MSVKALTLKSEPLTSVRAIVGLRKGRLHRSVVGFVEGRNEGMRELTILRKDRQLDLQIRGSSKRKKVMDQRSERRSVGRTCGLVEV